MFVPLAVDLATVVTDDSKSAVITSCSSQLPKEFLTKIVTLLLSATAAVFPFSAIVTFLPKFTFGKIGDALDKLF